MSTLYIIGNGFDRAHGLKTSYWDFRNYLEKYEREFLTRLEDMHGIPSYEKVDRRYKKNCEMWRWQEAVQGCLWKDFEGNLGKVNESEMMDISKSIVDDLHLDGGSIGIKDTMNVYWENQYDFIVQLNAYLTKWIKQVRINKALPQKCEFLDNINDLFFSFNYTNLLERIYHIPQRHVVHIHGGLPPYCTTSPVIGHGNQRKIEEYDELARRAAYEHNEGEESICNAIENYYKRTLKDTSRCLARVPVEGFIDALPEVDCIEVIGHSYGMVDMPYFTFLNTWTLDNKVFWKMYCFSDKDYAAAQSATSLLQLDEGRYGILSADQFWS